MQYWMETCCQCGHSNQINICGPQDMSEIEYFKNNISPIQSCKNNIYLYVVVELDSVFGIKMNADPDPKGRRVSSHAHRCQPMQPVCPSIIQCCGSGSGIKYFGSGSEKLSD